MVLLRLRRCLAGEEKPCRQNQLHIHVEGLVKMETFGRSAQFVCGAHHHGFLAAGNLAQGEGPHVLHNDILFLVAQVEQLTGVPQGGFRVGKAVKPAVTAFFLQS